MVYYNVRFSRRRSIGLVVSPQHGLLVRAPLGLGRRRIEEAIIRNTDWVLKKIEGLATQDIPCPPRAFVRGETLPYAGEELTLQVVSCQSVRGLVQRRGALLIVHVPFELAGDERRERIKKMLTSWYRQEARRALEPVVARFCAMLNLPLPQLKISNGKSRWGSCNNKGQVSLSWRLMLLPLHLSNYVVAHEVCHLRYLNHSKEFWQLLESVLPLAGALRKQLDKEAVSYQID